MIRETPSHYGIPLLKSIRQDTVSMEVVTQSVAADSENTEAVVEIEQEIECPRCHDEMTLCSDFDCMYYLCEECDFCLYTIKK